MKKIAKPKFLRVRELAQERGIKTAIDLMYETRLSQGTVYSIWNNDVARLDFKTLKRVADTLGVNIGDLFEPTLETNGSMVESEENETPVPICNLTAQSARGTEVIPAFVQSPNVQTRVPYRKAA